MERLTLDTATGVRPERRMTVVKGIFNDERALTDAVNGLGNRSVPADSIRVYLLDEAGGTVRELPVEDEGGALRGALIGAGLGGLAGLVIVGLALAGIVDSPGVDFFSLTTLSGAARAIATVAAAGVPLGAVIGMGHWQGRRKIAKGTFRRGRALVEVESDELAEVARSVIVDAGATRVTVEPGHDR